MAPAAISALDILTSRLVVAFKVKIVIYPLRTIPTVMSIACVLWRCQGCRPGGLPPRCTSWRSVGTRRRERIWLRNLPWIPAADYILFTNAWTPGLLHVSPKHSNVPQSFAEANHRAS